VEGIVEEWFREKQRVIFEGDQERCRAEKEGYGRLQDLCANNEHRICQFWKTLMDFVASLDSQYAFRQDEE
ncbi:hypothetical protein P4791_15470, partial [Listeria monocytogenes]|nr:hypothetical protein [Listeria monocytogenes]